MTAIIIRFFYKGGMKTLGDEDDIGQEVPQTEASGMPMNDDGPDFQDVLSSDQKEYYTASKYEASGAKMVNIIDQRPSEMILVGIPVQPSAQD